MSILIGLPVQRFLGACRPKRNQRHLRDPPTFSWELSRLLSNFRAKNAHLNWWQQLTPAHLKIPHRPAPVMFDWQNGYLPRLPTAKKTFSNLRNKDCSRTSCNLAESLVSWWKNGRDIGKTVSNGIPELGSSFCLPYQPRCSGKDQDSRWHDIVLTGKAAYFTQTLFVCPV